MSNKTDPDFQAKEEFIADYCRTVKLRHPNGLRMTPADVLVHELQALLGYDTAQPDETPLSTSEYTSTWLRLTAVLDGQRPPSNSVIAKEVISDSTTKTHDHKTAAKFVKSGVEKLAAHLAALEDSGDSDEPRYTGGEANIPSRSSLQFDDAFKAILDHYYREAVREAGGGMFVSSTAALQRKAQSAAKGGSVPLVDSDGRANHTFGGKRHAPAHDGRPASRNGGGDQPRGAYHIMLQILGPDAHRFQEVIGVVKPASPQELKQRIGGSATGTRCLDAAFVERVTKAHQKTKTFMLGLFNKLEKQAA
jgi:hypothetical protein